LQHVKQNVARLEKMCNISLMDKITADQIATHGGVTAAYGRMILAGERKPSLALAIKIYDATGARIGPLEGLSKREVETARKMAA